MGVIQNPAGAQGTPQAGNFDQRITNMVSAAAIAKNTVVSFSIASGKLTATQATTGVDTDLCRGICIDVATAAGQIVRVVTHGYVKDVAAQGAIAAGDTVGRSGTTAGSVAAVVTPSSGAALGIALTAAASNLVDVWVMA